MIHIFYVYLLGNNRVSTESKARAHSRFVSATFSRQVMTERAARWVLMFHEHKTHKCTTMSTNGKFLCKCWPSDDGVKRRNAKRPPARISFAPLAFLFFLFFCWWVPGAFCSASVRATRPLTNRTFELRHLRGAALLIFNETCMYAHCKKIRLMMMICFHSGRLPPHFWCDKATELCGLVLHDHPNYSCLHTI